MQKTKNAVFYTSLSMLQLTEFMEGCKAGYFPDIRITAIKQPQSGSPKNQFRRQKAHIAFLRNASSNRHASHQVSLPFRRKTQSAPSFRAHICRPSLPAVLLLLCSFMPRSPKSKYGAAGQAESQYLIGGSLTFLLSIRHSVHFLQHVTPEWF